MNKKVRKMVVASLTRSALIAWEARPRIPQPQEAPAAVSEPGEQNTVASAADAEMEKREGGGLIAKQESQFEGGDAVITIPSRQSQWQNISHSGWSSPLSLDLANLQYSTVVQELPHLIEARAVSLAPPDPELSAGPPLPDIRAVDVLQRPAAMGLREYIGHLTTVGIMTASPLTMEFLASYEYARFSGRPLSETEFRDLMKLFADLLRNMNGLTPDVLASLDIDPPESDMDQDGSTTSTPRTRSLVSSYNGSVRSESGGTIRSIPSRSIVVEETPSKHREKFSTAPATPRSKKTTMITKKSSVGSFAHSKRPYTGISGSSSSSMRSTSQSSVIRLSKTNGSSETPYILNIPSMRHR